MTVDPLVWDGRSPRKLSGTTGLTQLANGVVFYQGAVRRMDEAGMAGVPLASTDPIVADDTVPERVRRYSQTDEFLAPPPPPPPPATTFDPANKDADIVLSNGNLTATMGAAGWGQARTVATETALWDFQMTVDAIGGFVGVGVCNAAQAMTGFWAGSTDAVFYTSDGKVYYNFPTSLADLATYTTGDLIGCEVDPPNGLVRFRKNGGAYSAWLAIPGVGATVYGVATLLDTGATVTADFQI